MAPPEDLVAFCTREHPRLVGSLDLYCGDLGVAEELADEALIRVCDNWEKVRVMTAPGAWAHRVAMNLANSYYRRKKAERRAVARAAARTQLVHEDPDAADAHALREALHLLPPRQRTVIVLRYYLDLPPAEIAEFTNNTPGAVRTLTSRAIAALRRELGEGAIAHLEEVPDAT